MSHCLAGTLLHQSKDKAKENKQRVKASKAMDKALKQDGLTPISMDARNATLEEELKKFKQYRQPVGINLLSFLTPCSTADDFAKAAKILRQVAIATVDLKKAPNTLSEILNMRRLQHQLLLHLSFNSWEQFEAAYPGYHQKEKLEVLLRSLGM